MQTYDLKMYGLLLLISGDYKCLIVIAVIELCGLGVFSESLVCCLCGHRGVGPFQFGGLAVCLATAEILAASVDVSHSSATGVR